MNRVVDRLLSPAAKAVGLALFAIWTAVPILIVVSNAFKRPLDIFTPAPTVFFQPTLDNFTAAFVQGDFVKYFANSAIVAVVSTILVLTLSTIAAYGISSFRLRWARYVAASFFVGKLVPVIAILLPLFVFTQLIGIRGSLLAPIIAHASLQLPFMVWLLLGFLRDVPEELEQAAMIDGCTKMQAFWRVVLPVIRPGLAAAFILSMQFSWNELLFSLQLTNFDSYTLPVGIASFTGAISVNAGVSSAAATVTLVPMVILGFFVQKHIAAGTTGGAVKG